jgi:putative transposase
MTTELACNALKMAVTKRGRLAETLCHFDRGSQYASDIFQGLLKRYGFTCSMSRKGNRWDNAVAESSFPSLKVFSWIECFYNLKRRHSALGYVSPAVFERNALKEPEAA